MIPFKDDNPTSSTPYVTVSLIAINVLVFIWQMSVGLNHSVVYLGAIPAAMLKHEPLQNVPAQVTLFTSMFMHGGFMHLGGNMLYLWIFGDNIEDRLGRMRFLAFYLVGGIVAAYSHALTAPDSTIPMVGASGAIAAVLGAYVLLYPRAQVFTLLILGIFVQVIRLPALIVIGFWAIIQFASGFMASQTPGEGGVAWFAHIGGFIFGILIARFLIKDKVINRRNTRWS